MNLSDLEHVVYTLLMCGGITTIWFKSPAFVSFTQVLNYLLYGKNREKIYTHQDAILFGDDHLGKLNTLLNCTICMSFWTSLLFSTTYAFFVHLDNTVWYILTCIVLSPMFNYLILSDAGNNDR